VPDNHAGESKSLELCGATTTHSGTAVLIPPFGALYPVTPNELPVDLCAAKNTPWTCTDLEYHGKGRNFPSCLFVNCPVTGPCSASRHLNRSVGALPRRRRRSLFNLRLRCAWRGQSVVRTAMACSADAVPPSGNPPPAPRCAGRWHAGDRPPAHEHRAASVLGSEIWSERAILISPYDRSPGWPVRRNSLRACPAVVVGHRRLGLVENLGGGLVTTPGLIDAHTPPGLRGQRWVGVNWPFGRAALTQRDRRWLRGKWPPPSR